MGINMKFHFIKVNGRVLMIRYQFSDDGDEWFNIEPKFQSISYHPFVTSSKTVLSRLESMVNYANIRVNLTPEKATPYIEKRFTDARSICSIDSGNIRQSVLSGSSGYNKLMIEFEQKLVKEMESLVNRPKLEMQKFVGTKSKEFEPSNSGNYSSGLVELMNSLKGPSSNSNRPKFSAKMFDGKPNKDAESWLSSYEKFCFDNKCDKDSEKITALRSNLKDDALEWFESMVRNCVDDWHFWRSLFLAQFCKNRISAAISADKWEYRYVNKLMDYYYQKERFILIGYPTIDDYSFITKVIMGLPDDIQNKMIALNPQSKVELQLAFKKIDNQTIPFEDDLFHGGTQITQKTSSKLEQLAIAIPIRSPAITEYDELKSIDACGLKDQPIEMKRWQKTMFANVRNYAILIGPNAAAILADNWKYLGGALVDYYFEKQSLIQIAYPTIDESSLITRVIMRLPDMIQKQILTKSPQSKSNLQKAFEEIDNLKD